jgi:peptide/nickel transport system ATP-binding protein
MASASATVAAASVSAGIADEPTLLEVRHVSKQFDVGGMFSKKKLHALTDVSFDLARGEIVALVGESGSGKSTVARVVARLIKPDAGEVIFKGVDVIAKESRGASLDYRGDVQMIFKNPFGSLNPVQTIGHHLERPLRIHKKARGGDETRTKVEELLATVGLNPPAEFAAKYPHELSGGQRQRVAFARALAVEPEVMLADEPISMLDVSIRIGVMNLMERLKRERGIAYLYITHDIASARYLADRTMVMYAGRVVEAAASEDLIQKPAHPYTQRLLAAVPNPEAGHKTGGGVTGWEPPKLIDPPPGCPFAARCPHVMEVCRQVMPGETTIASMHWVRCHLYGAGN